MQKMMFTVVCLCCAVALPAFRASAEEYPQEVIERPLTLNDGMAQLRGAIVRTTGDFGFISITIFTAEVEALYGITDKLEAGVGFGFSLGGDFIDPFDIRILGLHLRYLAADTETWDVAPTLSFPINLGDGDALNGFTIGAESRVKLNDFVALVFGQNFLELYGLSDDAGVVINIEGGVGFQIDEMFYGQLLVSPLSMSSDGTRDLSDSLPFALTLTASPSNMVDIGVGVASDLQHLGDIYSLMASLAFRL